MEGLTAFQKMSCLTDSEPRPEWATLPKAADIQRMARSSNKDSSSSSSSSNKRFGVMGTILGECLCEPFPSVGDNARGMSQADQVIGLHGIGFIGLGAVADELTARERVYDTLEQLTSRTERLISIGYLVDQEQEDGTPETKVTETIPLDVWSKTYPNDKNMPRAIKNVIASMKERNYGVAFQEFKKAYETQKKYPNRNNNKYMAGITAHNMGVVSVLAGHEDMAMSIFQDAISLKRAAFGEEHPEVAISLDELGIQLFARENFDMALATFNDSRRILSKVFGPSHPKISMVLNNIACCNFQMGNCHSALLTLKEARDNHQQHVAGCSAQADLDLLHTAITLSNYGYLKVNLKQYEEAAACFEEALLIQQSVLGDAHNHRAIRDTRSNLEFTNAFHSCD